MTSTRSAVALGSPTAATLEVKKSAKRVSCASVGVPRNAVRTNALALSAKQAVPFPLAAQSTTAWGAAFTLAAIPATQLANGVKLAGLKLRLSAYS